MFESKCCPAAHTALTSEDLHEKYNPSNPQGKRCQAHKVQMLLLMRGKCFKSPLLPILSC
eukprot:1150843-Pelagomonas_calceolata.AAC.1